MEQMVRFIEHIAKRFGPRRGQQRGYPGHQEIELALVKLYRLEGEQRRRRNACLDTGATVVAA
jgi:hypothetical protein